jgi:hypothetical protein
MTAGPILRGSAACRHRRGSSSKPEAAAGRDAATGHAPGNRGDSALARRAYDNGESAEVKYGLDSIWILSHSVWAIAMTWDVEFHTDFVPEFEGLDESVQDELLAHVALLETFGPQLGRPRVDTLKGSRHANMKELRFDAADGVWRFALPSTSDVRPSSCAAATSPAAANAGSTGASP